MIWILLFSFAFGKPTPPPKAPPSRAEQILNPPSRTSLLTAGPLLAKIRSTIEKQDSFIRGEFDQPELQKKIADEIAASLHKLAPLSGQEIAQWLQTEGEVWWLYLERISYEEGTKTALDFSWKYRRSLVEVVKKKIFESEVNFPSGIVLVWLKRLEFRTPIDRLILSEARNQKINASRLVNIMQANPFRSIRATREKIAAFKHNPDLAKLDELWTDQNAKELQDLSQERDALVRHLEGRKPTN